jgi:DNA-binding response OmpR family regulator
LEEPRGDSAIHIGRRVERSGLKAVMVSVEIAYKPRLEQDKTTVLVVEDEIIIRLMVADALRAQGINVIEASNGDEALRVLQSSLPVQLLLTDIRMPSELDGLALAHAARVARPGLKLIVASSQLAGHEVAGLADAFFAKPFNLRAVVARVTSLLAEEAHHARRRR